MENIIPTKYSGIDKVHDSHGWYLMECRGGTMKPFDHEPTDLEIDQWREIVMDYYNL